MKVRQNSLTDEEWLVALAHVEAIRGNRAAAGIELEDDTPQWLVEAAMKMTLVERTEEESRPAFSDCRLAGVAGIRVKWTMLEI